MLWQRCFFILFINIASADKFIHLFGYDLLATTIKAYTDVSDPKQCAANCVNINANCTGFQVDWTAQTCTLLSQIRNYEVSLAECSFFIRNDSKVSGRGLTGIDALIQSNLYSSYESCPVGWTLSGSTCLFAVTEAECDQYPSYLDASYSAVGMCSIPVITAAWTCPTASQYGPTIMPDGVYYCYLLLTYKYSSSNTHPNYTQPASSCSAQGFTLASIHSANESSLLASKAKAVTVIGYITTTTVTASAFKWIDGTANDYSNWAASQPTGSPFYVTVMLPTGTWMVVYTTSSMMAVTRIACKAEATWTIS